MKPSEISTYLFAYSNIRILLNPISKLINHNIKQNQNIFNSKIQLIFSSSFLISLIPVFQATMREEKKKEFILNGDDAINEVRQ